jgi:hypothetical protein
MEHGIQFMFQAFTQSVKHAPSWSNIYPILQQFLRHRLSLMFSYFVRFNFYSSIAVDMMTQMTLIVMQTENNLSFCVRVRGLTLFTGSSWKSSPLFSGSVHIFSNYPMERKNKI